MIPTAPTAPQTWVPRAPTGSKPKGGIKRMNSRTSQRTAQTASTRLPDPGQADDALGDCLPFEEEESLSQSSDNEEDAVDDMLESAGNSGNVFGSRKFAVDGLVDRATFRDESANEDCYLRFLREEMEGSGFDVIDDIDVKGFGMSEPDSDIMELMAGAFDGDMLFSRNFGSELYEEVDMRPLQPCRPPSSAPSFRRIPGWARLGEPDHSVSGRVPAVGRLTATALRQQALAAPQQSAVDMLTLLGAQVEDPIRTPDLKGSSGRPVRGSAAKEPTASADGAGCTSAEDTGYLGESADVEDLLDGREPSNYRSYSPTGGGDSVLALHGQQRQQGAGAPHAGPIANALRRARSQGQNSQV